MNTMTASAAPTATVLELTVRSRPGTMPRLTGLLARRGLVLEALLCVPSGNGDASSMLLLLGGHLDLEQLRQQLARRFDLLALRRRDDLDPAAFRGVAGLIGMGLAA